MKNLPDKIYIPRTNMEVENYLEEFWVDHKTFDDDVEYIRSDAFIEKARKWFEKRNEWINLDGTRQCDMEGFEDFKKYMEGE